MSFIGGLFLFLFWRVSSWLCSIPMWLTLILHFTLGLPIGWFWATLAAWLLAGLIRWALVVYGRWGSGATEMPEKENKNPYSHRDETI